MEVVDLKNLKTHALAILKRNFLKNVFENVSCSRQVLQRKLLFFPQIQFKSPERSLNEELNTKRNKIYKGVAFIMCVVETFFTTLCYAFSLR